MLWENKGNRMKHIFNVIWFDDRNAYVHDVIIDCCVLQENSNANLVINFCFYCVTFPSLFLYPSMYVSNSFEGKIHSCLTRLGWKMIGHVSFVFRVG